MAQTRDIETIKQGIAHLYAAHPQVHMNIRMTKSKLQLQNAPVVIQGVYKNLFTISERNFGVEKIHTLTYGDILIGDAEILKLNDQ